MPGRPPYRSHCRAMAAIHRVARTLADLEGRDDVTAGDVLVAAGMREEVL